MGWVADLSMKTVDTVCARIPYPPADRARLAEARIVAHRGAHHGGIIENTWPAFEAALELGAWGVELDVRWSADGVPVVMHDASPRRLFPAVHQPIAAMRSGALVRELPQVPLLEALVARLGGRLHLMIELKEPLDTAAKRARMARLLAPLTPVVDFHILSLEPVLFEGLGFLPPQCFLPVAQWNVHALSQQALMHGWGGITGHYLRLSDTLRQRHQAMGQALGTGFIRSENLLHREIGRGVDWVFTDHCHRLRPALERAREA